MSELKIDPDFRDLLSPLTDEEFKALKDSITRDGVEDPIKTWNGYIVDGHNRYRICNELGIKDFPIREKRFDSKSEAMDWIIENQKGRRNLTMSQLVKCYSKVEEQMAKEAKERQIKCHGNQYTKSAVVSNLKQQQKEPEPRTVDKIAEKVGVSRNTYLAAKQVVAKGTDEEIKRLDKGGKGNGAQRIATEIKARESGLTVKKCSKCHKTKPISEFNPSGLNGNFKSYCIECEHEMKNKNRKKETQADRQVAEKLKIEDFYANGDDGAKTVSLERIEREVLGAVEIFLDTVKQISSDEFDHGEQWKGILVKAQQQVVSGLAEL